MQIKQRTIVVPDVESDFSSTGDPLVFWKQVLPQKLIHYTTKSGKRATLDLNEQYLTDLAQTFENKVLDQTPFMLADSDNKHTMDAERQRGEVEEMRLAVEGESPGLYAKIKFATADAARAVLANPKLGVSARIREGIERNDGSFAKRGIIHVLGTLDPQVTGMAPWVPAVDLSFDPTDNILDLSGETYQGATVAEKTPAELADEAPELETMTEEEATAWAAGLSEEELEAFLELHAPDILADINNSTEELEPVSEDAPELEPALSAKATQDIELANSRAQAAQDRADEALRKMADAEFKAYRTEKMSEGVPPWVLDLAVPVLNRPDDMQIDLSNEGDGTDTLNVAEIVRKLVDGYKGSIDLSNERGHGGVVGAEGDTDKAELDMWTAEFGR